MKSCCLISSLSARASKAGRALAPSTFHRPHLFLGLVVLLDCEGLGPTCLKKFCKAVYSAVTSPYLLHDLALEAARNFALYNPAQLNSHLRSPSVSPIVHKAMAMYTELLHHDLVFLSSRGHSDFVDLLRRARSAFAMAAGGMTRFNEILDVIRKTYPKKRELWQLIMNGLSKA